MDRPHLVVIVHELVTSKGPAQGHKSEDRGNGMCRFIPMDCHAGTWHMHGPVDTGGRARWDRFLGTFHRQETVVRRAAYRPVTRRDR